MQSKGSDHPDSAPAELASLKEMLAAQVARTETLARATRIFTEESLNLQGALDAVAKRVAELIGDGAIITLLSPDGEWLEAAALYHRDPETLKTFRPIFLGKRFPVTEGRFGKVMQ